MTSNKSQVEIEQTVRNIAKEMNINDTDFENLKKQLGL